MRTESLSDHFHNPRNVGEIPSPDAEARAGNPVCGDDVRVTLSLAGGRIRDVRYRAFGCHATIAAMSALTERIRDASIREARAYRPEDLTRWFADFPPGKAHAAEVAIEAVRAALREARP